MDTVAALLIHLAACLAASEDSLQGLLAPARLAQCQALGCRREGDAGSRPWWIKHLVSDAGWVASCSFGRAWPLLQSSTVKATARGMEQPASGSQRMTAQQPHTHPAVLPAVRCWWPGGQPSSCQDGPHNLYETGLVMMVMNQSDQSSWQLVK